jgi:polyhydroxyalkanoate synthesis regulator phasin
MTLSVSSSSSPSDAVGGTGSESAELSALVAALVHELLCAEEVVRNARLVREEMEAMVMQLVGEITEREAGEAGGREVDCGNKTVETEGTGAPENELKALEDELKALRREVAELQIANARLRERMLQSNSRP